MVYFEGLTTSPSGFLSPSNKTHNTYRSTTLRGQWAEVPRHNSNGHQDVLQPLRSREHFLHGWRENVSPLDPKMPEHLRSPAVVENSRRTRSWSMWDWCQPRSGPISIGKIDKITAVETWFNINKNANIKTLEVNPLSRAVKKKQEDSFCPRSSHDGNCCSSWGKEKMITRLARGRSGRQRGSDRRSIRHGECSENANIVGQ